jgi:hypothetical protein
MNTLTIHEAKSGGIIRMIKKRKNSKFIDLVVALDHYGFTTQIEIKQLKEFIE